MSLESVSAAAMSLPDFLILSGKTGTAHPRGPIRTEWRDVGLVSWDADAVGQQTPCTVDAPGTPVVVDVRGPVGEDLRAVGGDINIEGTVAGEVYAAGGNVSLARSSRVGLGMSVAAGPISIDRSGPRRLRAAGRPAIAWLIGRFAERLA